MVGEDNLKSFALKRGHKPIKRVKKVGEPAMTVECCPFAVIQLVRT